MAAVPVTSTIQTQIANLYIAILGRNPEPAGFGFWCDTLANNGGTQAALNAITIGFSNSPEFIATYGGQTTNAAITLMYNNVLNRAPDANGLAYWTAQYNTLIATGNYTVSQALALTGNAIITTAAANTGTADQTNIQAKEAAAIAAGTTAPSTTVALTTDIDTLTIGNNTTVIGTVTGNPGGAVTQTLNAGDSIVGNGTNNTLRIIDTNTGAVLNPLSGVTVSGVQTVTVQNVGGVTDVYNLAAITGVTTVQNTNSTGGTVSFTNLAAGTTVSVSGSAAAAGITTAAYAVGSSPVTVNLNGGLTTVQTINVNTGTNTAATITSTGGVNGVATNGTAANAILNLAAGATLTSLTVNAATNMRATLTAGNFAATGAALTVSGAATSVNLGNAGVYKTIDASGLTAGGVTVNASTTLTSFTGGTGNDNLTNNAAGTAAIAATAVIDAGAGVDTVSASLINAGNAAVFKNFEQLGLATAVAPATVTLDASLLTNSTITGVTMGATVGATAISNLVETGTGFNVSVTATGATGGTTLGFTAASVVGTADVLNYSFAGTSGAAIAAGTVTHQGIELVNIASNGITGSTNSLTITDTALQSITVTGSKQMTVSVTAQGLVGTATATALTTVNASGMTPSSATNGLIFTENNPAAATSVSTGLTITGSSANDTITVLTQSAAAHTIPDNAFGSDTVILTSGGNDSVVVTGATSQLATGTTATAFGLTTITGANSGDSVTFALADVMAAQAATDVSAAGTLNAALNIAAVSAGVGAGAWFNFAGNTYVIDNVAGAGFSVADIVVKLTGTVDLSNSAMVAGVLTIA